MDLLYGTYPGAFKDKCDYLDKCSEIELFLAINEKIGYINFLKDDFKGAGYQYSDIDEEYFALDYVILLTRRFDVNIEQPMNGARVSRKGEAKDWYNWWHDYVYKNLTLEERTELKQHIEAGEDVSSYRPEGKWKSTSLQMQKL